MLPSLPAKTMRAVVALLLCVGGLGAAALTAAAPASAGLLPGIPDTLSVTAPATAVVGTPVAVTVSADLLPGIADPGYTGTIHFTSTDATAVLPADYTFTSADAGTHSFMITFKTVAAASKVTATDKAASGGATAGTSGNVMVTKPVATKLLVTAPATAVAGTAVNVTVTAKDASGATVPDYTGTVKLTSTDPMVMVPANYQFTAAEMGVHVFQVTFKTAGSQTVTATDAATSTITGTSSAVTVSATATPTTTQVGTNPSLLRALVTAGTGTTTGTPAATPTGTVTFTVNGAVVGTADLDAHGLAAVAYTLPAGRQVVTASYPASGGFAASNGSRVVTGPQVTTALSSAFAKTSYGWYRSNVKVAYTCSAGSSAVLACPGTVTLTTQGGNVTVTKTVVDKDGGRTVVTTTVKIDKTKPTVTVGGVQKGHTYATDPKIKCTAHDSLSGVASCKVVKTRNGKAVSYTATGTDKAGNTTRVRGTYKLT